MTRTSTSPIRRCAGVVLIALGSGVLVWGAVDQGLTVVHQRRLAAALEDARAAHASPTPLAAPAPGDPIGTLEIPRVGVKGMVVHGDDESVLRRAIGHLPDTPLPWQPGNAALAAHRDSWFRGLRHVQPGDRVRLATSHGDFEYRVRETLVVDPDALWVLDTTRESTLTLITCYPFDHVGPAPRRFIVRAERLVEVLEEAAAMERAPVGPVRG